MLLKADKTNKLTPNFDSIPRIVVEKDGKKVTLGDERGNVMTRYSSFVKEYYGDNETQWESNNNSTSNAINSGSNGLNVTSTHLFVLKIIACVKLYFLL